MSNLLNQAQAAVQQNVLEDMTDTSSGGNFERKLLPVGVALVRFSGYIDLGTQTQRPYQGKAKPPAPEAKLVFHVVGGMGKDEEGKMVPYVTAEDAAKGYFPRISPFFDLTISHNEKSRSTLVFNALNYAGDAKHFVEKLGALYLLPIRLTEDKKYNDYDFRELREPIDAMSGQMYPAPELPEDKYQLFLWNSPTIEQWESIFIDGTTQEGKSKNYIQEKIQKATNFVGSPVERLLMSGGVSLPTLATDDSASNGEPTELPAVPTV